MAKDKKKKRKLPPMPLDVGVPDEETTEASKYARSIRALQNMKRRDIQRECVMKGLDFERVAGLSTPDLIIWFQENFDNTHDLSLLNLYDDWKDKKLEEKGYGKDDPLRSPLFNLAVSGNPDDWDEQELKRSTKPKKGLLEFAKNFGKEGDAPKPNTSKAPSSVKAGTKKAYTYELAQSRDDDWTYSKEQIIDMVMREFPLAAESSIKAWTSKARKLIPTLKP